MIRVIIALFAISLLFLTGCTAGIQNSAVQKRIMEDGYGGGLYQSSIVDKEFPSAWAVYKDFPKAEIAFAGIKEIKPRSNRFSQDFYNDEVFVWHNPGQPNQSYISRDEFAELKKKIYPHLLKYQLKKGEHFNLYTLKSFDFNEFHLNSSVTENLKNIIDDIKKSSGVVKAFFGHTDEVGSEVYNLPLSSNRAKIINQVFLDSGLTIEPVPTVGLGETTQYGNHPDCRNVVVVTLVKR